MNASNEADDTEEIESTETVTRVPPDESGDEAGPDPIEPATRVP